MKIAIVAGGNRRQSTSTLLARYIQTCIEQAGHEVSFIDLYTVPLPFFSPDQGASDNAEVLELQQKVGVAQAIVLATPDYHGGPSGVLKNALDHLGFDHFDGKAVLSASSSGGAVGVSPLQQLQTIVRNVHGINCPEWISIGGQFRQFDELGQPEEETVRTRVQRTVGYFLQMAEKLRPLSS
ncbi:NAD(P)H-dependent oxidoreductase [Paenibacillus sp. IB182496]|uniref:NAD(P)H-dependent oxidoreductase n=1 Tax=Paenibacillus sabuli TaxID=2772509 RepID=A0A927BVC0_9BACL|nr:NADPH-dependent FMN reductase [Paenibacillus sabuli]MBD2846038.1 NAD(P)H-dependent oxidoreductase [Paenibacillus sabuli]